MYVNQTATYLPSFSHNPTAPHVDSSSKTMFFCANSNTSQPLSRKEKRKIQRIHKMQQKYVKQESDSPSLMGLLKNALWSRMESSFYTVCQYGLQVYNALNRRVISLDRFISNVTNFTFPFAYAKTQSTWLTAFTDDALEYGAKERVERTHKNFELIDIQKLSLPEYGSHQVVGWDQGRVASVHEKRLFSTGFGPCLAVLAQGFEEHAQQPSYMALHHVFLNAELFSSTLDELSQKIHSGTIKIYISGGQAATRKYLTSVTRIINVFNARCANVKSEIVANTFGIADIGRLYKRTKTTFYPESCGIKYVGFDDTMRPYQIIGITQEHNPAGIEGYIWENDAI